MKLTILAVTKMNENRICVAGINESGEWIRPIKEHPLHLEINDIFQEGKVIYNNFNRIDIPLKCRLPNPPHIEDHIIDIEKPIRLICTLSSSEKKDFLIKNCENLVFKDQENITVKDILEHKNRSLILVGPVKLIYVVFEKDKTPRILFEIEGLYKADKPLPCKDMKFQTIGTELLNNSRCDKLVMNHSEIHKTLKSESIFISLGLTRLFKGEHHAMIVGLYSIPDYHTNIDYGNLK
jgi:hypothetical protein